MKSILNVILPLFLFYPLSGFSAEKIDKSFRLGLSENYLMTTEMQSSSTHGMGLSGFYEFNLTSKFTLGINLEYRYFAGNQGISQLGYGLIMKHNLFGEMNKFSCWKPYVEYGLLMNVTRQKDRSNSGTSHDTRLAIGSNLEVFEFPVFIEAAYDISRLVYFEQEKINLDYLQFTFGWTSRF